MRTWRIQEYDSLQLVGTYLVPATISRPEMCQILRLLAARHLQSSEIIHASLRRRMRGRNDLLEVRRDEGVLQIGENPFFVATIVEDDA